MGGRKKPTFERVTKMRKASARKVEFFDQTED